MNKKNLALLISKHPLMRKLTEDKTIPKSIVARLIVEELMEAQTGLLKSALAGIRRDFNQGKQRKYIDAETKQAVYPYGKLSELDDTEQQKYKDAVNKKVQAFLAQQNPETKAQGEKIEKQVDAAIKKEIGTPQDTEQEDETFNSLAPPAQKIVDNIASVVVDIDAEEKFLTTYDQNAPAAIDFVINKLPEEHVDVLKTASPETQQKVAKAVVDKLQKDQQEPETDGETSGEIKDPEPSEIPEEEPSSTTDPEKFDVDPELLNSLIETSETFIDEFYEKAFLKDQGILLKNVLTVLATIVEKEELEKAARRTPKPTEQSEEAEETVTEQEEQPRQDPVKLRNIQVDLKSFIKLVKRSKDVLKTFDEFRAKGKVVGSSYKEKFMSILKQLQKNIKALVRDISTLNLISEKKDVSETENKWSAIEKGYNEASRSLSNIIAAGDEDIESFDMEKNVNDAYTSLMSISSFFPSVNPFGTKTTNFNEYNELYTAAVKDIKSTIRDVLELAKGKGGSNTISNTVESLKQFSGQIQSIFDIPSQFEDVQIKPNEKAAENEEGPTEPETKTVDPFENEGILKLPKPEKLTSEQEQVLKDIEYSEEDTKIVNRVAQVFVGVDSVPTEPEKMKKAAEEVKGLKREMEEMTEMSNQFGFKPEEMRAMVGLKRFLETEPIKISESQEPRATLKIPLEISEKIAEYGERLKKANEGSHEVFVIALEKAAALSEPEKNKFYKFLGIPRKKDVDRERALRDKIAKKAKKLDSKDPMKYFENYYDGDTALTPSTDDQENKKQKTTKLNQNFSKLFSLYSEKLFDDDKTSVTESVMANVKRLLTEEEYRALDKAFDFLLKKISTTEYQEMLGFIGQVGSKVLEPTKTAPQINPKKHNAFDIFIEVLKGISYGILQIPSGGFDHKPTKTFTAEESLHEQLANKLKPLIKEMLTKGK